MDIKTVQYIITHFRNLMTDDEKSAPTHHMNTYNIHNEFELNIAKRIMTETPEKVFFNNCPKCNKLARTPYAKQCRYCGYSWHHLVVAEFKIKSVLQITGRKFFLLGEIIKGEIKEDQQIDLTLLGINKRPKIESIEFALTRKNGEAWEDIGIGMSTVTEEEELYLKNIDSFTRPVDIICE